MRNTEIFEKFLDTPYGIRAMEFFNKEKTEFEDFDWIVKKLKVTAPENYLDIGGGPGLRTMKVAKDMGCRNIDFVEPSAGSCRNFTKLAKLSGIRNVSTFSSSFEDFDTEKKYDFITSIHSWYYIDLDSLERMYDMLKDGGAAAILMDSETDIIRKIQLVCEKRMCKFNTNGGEDVIKKLGKLGIKHDVYEHTAMLSGLLNNGKFTKKAKAIISLLAYTKWSDIDEDTRNEIRCMLENISKKDKYPTKRFLVIIKK